MNENIELVEVICKILDATVEDNSRSQEHLADDEAPKFEQHIVLLMKVIDGGKLFKSTLSEPDIRELIGITRPLQSREMINFASNLRARTDPVRMMVDPRSQEVTPEMLRVTHNPKDYQEVTDDPVDLTEKTSTKTTTVNKFDYRKTKENS